MALLAIIAAVAVSVLGAAALLAAAGDITTVAGGFIGDGGSATSAQLDNPVGVVVDASGNLFIASDHRIRRVDASTGVITTVAGGGFGLGDGGPATSAQLDNPIGVVVDTSGNLFIADYLNNRIRRVDAATGVITTVAGDGTCCFSGEATAARLPAPD